MLELKQISKTFQLRNGDATETLQDVSLKINRGEFVAVIGPSGSGKTTLLRIIAGLISSSSGDIILNKKKITGTSKDRGMVFQHFSLFPWLTVADNIAFGLKLKKLPKKQVEEIVNRYLVITGLTQFKSTYPHTLSGGMQQRAAIARTLANNPEVILLDEPFGALDVQTRSQMQEFLAKIWDEEKRTTIMVTHDVEEALYVADKIIVLSTKPGSIKEIVEVPFERPRRSEIRFQPDFVRLKKYLTYAIRSESIKATTDIKSLKSHNNDLVIGSNIWTGIAPFYLAKEKGLFTKYELKTEIATLEWSQDRLKPWREDLVDTLDTPLDSVLIEFSKNPKLRIFMPLDVSIGGDAIIAHKPIAKMEDLKGKRIGVEKNWVSHFFLCYVLHKMGMSSHDVVLEDMKASDIGSEIISGRIDAASIQEPWLSKAKELAQTKILVTSKDYPIVYAVLIAKAETLERKRREFAKLRNAWTEALGILEKNKTEAIKIIAPYLGIPEVEFAEQIEGIKFVDPHTDLMQAMKETQEVLLKESFINAPLDLANIVEVI